MDKILMKKGLGDYVENIIKFLFPRLAARFKAKGCGCDKRRKYLNKLGKNLASYTHWTKD